MDDKLWANESLRMALQQIKDVETKSLHEEIDRLQRELTEARSERNTWEDTASYHYAESCDNERKLTEAKELLRDARDRFSFVSDTLHDRIDAFLAEKEGER